MYKKIIIFISFLLATIIPANLFALQDEYTISGAGVNGLLYSNYEWIPKQWYNNVSTLPKGAVCDDSTKEYWFLINKNKSGCEGIANLGKQSCGVWSATSPGATMYLTKYYRRKCAITSNVKSGEKELRQNRYMTDNGSDAFCVNPGKAFTKQTYVKSEVYDVSNCTMSNDSYNCALAAVFTKYSNSNYLTKLTALRLIAASYNQGGGWWDSHEDQIYADADIFVHTASKIKNNGYNYTSSNYTSEKGILYDKGKSNGSFQSGIEIFEDVMKGFEIWTPSVKVVSKSYNGSQVTLNIETNFDGMSTISDVTYNGHSVNYSVAECSNSSSKTCMTVTFDLSSNQVNNCKNKIRVHYNKPGAEAISKVYLYEAKYNPGKYQQMVVFDTENTTPYVDVSICPSDNPTPNVCRYVNGKYYGKDGREVDEETYAKECDSGKCSNTKIEYNMPKDCEDDGTSGTISDPTMCTIMNSTSSVKNSYKKDYGNEYCTVYCRESLEFHFMDKETAIAGRYFNHNVESYKTNKQYLSTVILSTRQCSSIIDYDKWKKAYDNANQNVLDTWNQLKIIEAQVNNITSSESSKDCPGGSISGCRHSHDDDFDCKYDNNGNWVCDHSKYTIPGAYCNSKTIKCTSYDWSGARYRHTYPNGSTSIINVGGSDTCSLSCNITCKGCDNSASTASAPSYRGESGAYNNAVSTRNSLINKINSCNFVEGSDAYNKVMDYNPKNTISIDYAENFEYDQGYDINIKNDSTSNEVVKRTYANSSDWSSFCGKDCNGNLSNLSSSSNNVTLTYWDCSGSETSAICSDKGVNVPQNRLANIEVERETLHYQSNEFYVQAFTGLVSTKKSNTGFWLSLKDNDKHLYPVSSVRRSGNYGIKVTYSNLGDPKSTRKMANGNYTCSYDVVNELTIYDCDDNYDDHTCKCLDGTDCSKNVDGQVGLGVYYRPISLNDVFPHSSYSPTVGGTINVNTRNIGENWTTAKAVQVVKEIQSSGDNLIVDKKPQYVVKLTPTIMKKIRSYNDNTTYLDNSIYKCDDNLICYSSFLDKDLKNIMGSSNYRILYSKDSSIKSDSLFYYINK